MSEDCYTDLDEEEEIKENYIDFGVWKFIEKLKGKEVQDGKVN